MLFPTDKPDSSPRLGSQKATLTQETHALLPTSWWPEGPQESPPVRPKTAALPEAGAQLATPRAMGRVRACTGSQTRPLGLIHFREDCSHRAPSRPQAPWPPAWESHSPQSWRPPGPATPRASQVSGQGSQCWGNSSPPEPLRGPHETTNIPPAEHRIWLIWAPSHTLTPLALSPGPPFKSMSSHRRSAAPYLRVALSPCRTVTLSIALGKVASPLRTGTPVGTRNSSLRDTTTRHFQGRNRYPQTPILDSHNFPEGRPQQGPGAPPHTPAGLRQRRGERQG